MQNIFLEKGLDIIAPGIFTNESYLDMELLGTIVLLFSQSKNHGEIPIHLLRQLLFPAISHKQFILILKKGSPIFFCSWALLDESAEQRYLDNPAVLMPQADWNSGHRLWITDWVAPFGDCFYLSRLLMKTVFAQQCMHSLYHRGDEKGFRVMTFKGQQVSDKQFNEWKQHHSALNYDNYSS